MRWRRTFDTLRPLLPRRVYPTVVGSSLDMIRAMLSEVRNEAVRCRMEKAVSAVSPLSSAPRHNVLDFDVEVIDVLTS